MTSLHYPFHFHQRWPQLVNRHVRSLAWILDSPNLLNINCDTWDNQLAELPPLNQSTVNWLLELEKNPEPLANYLAVHPQTRLGHYAENLLAFYFLWRGNLLTHRVQVHSHSHTTIGEFDFLLTTPSGLVHWEFACKFYFLVPPQATLSDYVGPNLMDNLSEKSRKIMTEQLALGQHPDAIKHLLEPVTSAKALIKGWLFYASRETQPLIEVAPNHCRGLWRRLGELKNLNADCFIILPRLHWLAPAKARQSETICFDQLHAHLTGLFLTDVRPILVAQLVPDGEFFIEAERIFVVPDEWN
ncbi:MAG: hypothetical protein K0R08_1035 [Solimicrobium sp.]|jgi:hypothetical protein|nr:hypothetical protein [Solimicrobium sp.]